MLAQGDVAAVAAVVLDYTHVATFELVLVTISVCLILPADLVDADCQEDEEQ